MQVARAFGGRIVIGVDISDKKLEMAKQMGATHTINASTEDVPQRVRVSSFSFHTCQLLTFRDWEFNQGHIH